MRDEIERAAIDWAAAAVRSAKYPLRMLLHGDVSGIIAGIEALAARIEALK
jgi:hypothetical protein